MCAVGEGMVSPAQPGTGDRGRGGLWPHGAPDPNLRALSPAAPPRARRGPCLYKCLLESLLAILWGLDLEQFCFRKEDPFQGPKLGSCLTLRNELSKETHVLTKQEILLGKGTRVESSRVREPRRTALPRGSQSRVLW